MTYTYYDIRNNDHSDKIRTALNSTSQAQRQINSSKNGKKEINIENKIN